MLERNTIIESGAPTMSERTQQVRDVLLEALEIDGEADRANYLARACGTDRMLRREVEQLLQAAAQASGFLPEQTGNRPAADAFVESAAELYGSTLRHAPGREHPGDRIGRYRLVRKLGEGGCGLVYLAEQEEPFRREVALKVIKLGMDTAEVVARFEAERQVLALMEHANIARVFDAGATRTGRPYFVMELVSGTRITEFCDQRRLGTAERLELFIQVCHAVQHAHQKGVIHRDLKASNVLVTETNDVPVPKVIDFGIAKATQGPLTENAFATVSEQFLGTPAYVSPEQATLTRVDVDTRSDIYSLGVLLYELLTGKTPFDTALLTGADFQEMQRVIREKVPPRPSTRLCALATPDQTVAAQRRGCDPPKLLHALRGDLDWIVMKCLEKDRSRRYATANDLASDLQRHLHHEPVLARPPSRLYEFRKTVRRHTLGFALTASLILALTGGVVVSSNEAYRAHKAERVHRNLLATAEAAIQTASRSQRRAEEAAAQARLLETRAREALRQSYLAQARTSRWSRRAGRRAEALDLLAKGAEIRPGADLRNEAVACLALSDIQLVRQWKAYSGEHRCGFDSKYELYTFDDDQAVVHVCRTDNDQEVAQFSGFEARFQQLGFTPDSRLLFVASGERASQLQFFELRSGSNYWRLTERPFRALTFTANSQLAAISYERPEANFPVRILDMSKKQELASFPHGTCAANLRFHPVQSHLLLTSDMSGEVRLWDWQKGEVVQRFSHPDWVSEVDCHPGGRWLATACADKNLRMWDATLGVAPGKNPKLLAGHEGIPVRVSFSFDGNFLLSGGWEGVVRLWDAHEQHELVSLPVGGFNYPFALSGTRFAAFTGEGTIGLYEASASRAFRVLYPQDFPQETRVCCDFSPDGRLLVGCSESGFCLWDTQSWQEVFRMAVPEEMTFARFHPDGIRLLVATRKGIKIFRVTQGLQRFAVEQEPGGVYSAAGGSGALFLGAAGKVLSSGAEVTWLDAAPGGVHRRLEAPAGREFGALSPDGTLATAFARVSTAAVEIWDVNRQMTVTNLPAHPCLFASFSPDSRWLATGDSCEIRLWDTRTWQSTYAFPRDAAGNLGYLAFSADGQLLAAAISRTKVMLVEVTTGRILATLEPPEARDIHWIAFRPDGSQVAIAAGTGSVHNWDLRALHRELAHIGLAW